MLSFNRRYINVLSFFISLILIIFLNNYVFSNNNFESDFLESQNKIQENQSNISNQTKEIENKNTESSSNNTQEIKKEKNKKKKKNEWKIEIPCINLSAKIAEGTSQEVMSSFVGHFEDTPKDKGNIGLAAHNRGYEVNYFENVKNLKEGDEIIYKYNKKQQKYIVKTIKIIKDTDWSMLQNTEENRITLITCVENQPEYRRCVQAVEKTSE